MKISVVLLFSALLPTTVGCSAANSSDVVPTWLTEAATRKLPAYSDRVPAAVLINEVTYQVDDMGRYVRSVHLAIKVLNQEGKAQAIANQLYLVGNSKVRELRAWAIVPNGDVLNCGKKEAFDRTSLPGSGYEEVRIRGIDGRTKVDVGSVFGFEAITESRPLINQIEEYTQLSLPAVLVRYRLILPPGWHAQSTIYNHEKIEPTTEGSTYSWELRNLPFIDSEPASLPLASLVPRLQIGYFPPNGQPLPVKGFANWSDVSGWLAGLMDPPATPDENVAQKARSLVQGATTNLQRIKALAAYVQAIRYEAIEIGISHGGGFRPRPASDTLGKQYGDCKDKATLFRSLLSAIGIRSMTVVVNASDRSYVHAEWPSPIQFNHAIVAIQLDADSDGSAVLLHPSLGKLLLFDPTNAVVPCGNLPLYEQGGLGLFVAPKNGDLVKLPMTKPTDNIVTRNVDAELQNDGTLNAVVTDHAIGQAAANDRQLLNSNTKGDFFKVIERWVAVTAKGAAVSKVEPADSFAANQFRLHVEFSANRYGQVMNGKLIIFKPVIVGRRESVLLIEPTRTSPVLLQPVAFDDSVRIKIPRNLKIDEMPDPDTRKVPFGEYRAKCESGAGEIVCTHHLEIRAAVIPVNQYLEVRDFFRQILAWEQTPVVLSKPE